MRGHGRVWLGRGIVVAAAIGALAGLLAAERGVSGSHLQGSWQLIDLWVLEESPLGSVWYLHIQPPLHNLLIGVVVAWSPFPTMGTLFALYGISLLVAGLFLHDLIVRWGVPPIVGGLIVGVAVADPTLLSTIRTGSYEVPVAAMLILVLWLAQRYFDDPRARWLLLTALVMTLGALTRSLLHPVWVLGVLALMWLVRSVDRRQVVASLAIPLVLIGGWMVKNQVIFGTPTLTSWLGFNMQRGVTAPMGDDAVEQAVAEGAVSPIVLEYPWLPPEFYAEWTGSCSPAHEHLAARAEVKRQYPGVMQRTLNFNNECLLPAYQQAERDAFTLIRRHPDRYLTQRTTALFLSYQTAPVSGDYTGGEPTWMDRLYDPVLGTSTMSRDMSDWNLRFLDSRFDVLHIEYSVTLVVLSLLLVARSGVAAVRLVRRGWRARRDWPGDELVWLLAAGTVVLVVVGGDLIELGENGRFRAMVDPLIITLPLSWVVLAVKNRFARPAAAGDDATGIGDGGDGNGRGGAPEQRPASFEAGQDVPVPLATRP